MALSPLAVEAALDTGRRYLWNKSSFTGLGLMFPFIAEYVDGFSRAFWMAERLAASPSGGDCFHRSNGSAGLPVGVIDMGVARPVGLLIIYLLFLRGSPLWRRPE